MSSLPDSGLSPRRKFAQKLTQLFVDRGLSLVSLEQCRPLLNEFLPEDDDVRNPRKYKAKRFSIMDEIHESYLEDELCRETYYLYRVPALREVLRCNWEEQLTDQAIRRAAHQIALQLPNLKKQECAAFVSKKLARILERPNYHPTGSKALWDSELFLSLATTRASTWKPCAQQPAPTPEEIGFIERQARNVSTRGWSTSDEAGRVTTYFIAGFFPEQQAFLIEETIREHNKWFKNIPLNNGIDYVIVMPSLVGEQEPPAGRKDGYDP